MNSTPVSSTHTLITRLPYCPKAECEWFHTYIHHITGICPFKEKGCTKELPETQYNACIIHSTTFDHSPLLECSDYTITRSQPKKYGNTRPVDKKQGRRKTYAENDKLKLPLSRLEIEDKPRKCAFISEKTIEDGGRVWRKACSENTRPGFLICNTCWDTEEGKNWLAEVDPVWREKYKKKLLREESRSLRLTTVLQPPSLPANPSPPLIRDAQ